MNDEEWQAQLDIITNDELRFLTTVVTQGCSRLNLQPGSNHQLADIGRDLKIETEYRFYRACHGISLRYE